MGHDVPRHSSGDTARLVGLDRWRLIYLVERGDLPNASLTVAGRRLFSDAEIDRIREILSEHPNLRGSRAHRQQAESE
jgi:hypothetical protein